LSLTIAFNHRGAAVMSPRRYFEQKYPDIGPSSLSGHSISKELPRHRLSGQTITTDCAGTDKP
jgi:hypothetical protein